MYVCMHALYIVCISILIFIDCVCMYVAGPSSKQSNKKHGAGEASKGSSENPNTNLELTTEITLDPSEKAALTYQETIPDEEVS